EKSVQEVTLGRPSCPAQGETRSSGHARASNVPGSERKSFKRSRKSVQRARFGEKIIQEVTLGRSTCPAQRENRSRGNARASIMPGSARKSLQRSRKSVHRSQPSENTIQVATQEHLSQN